MCPAENVRQSRQARAKRRAFLWDSWDLCEGNRLFLRKMILIHPKDIYHAFSLAVTMGKTEGCSTNRCGVIGVICWLKNRRNEGNWQDNLGTTRVVLVRKVIINILRIVRTTGQPVLKKSIIWRSFVLVQAENIKSVRKKSSQKLAVTQTLCKFA